MCISWRWSCRCAQTLARGWETAKIFGERCSKKNGCWEKAFCKGHVNAVVLLGLAESQPSLLLALISVELILQAVNGSWLLCHCWSSRGDFQK